MTDIFVDDDNQSTNNILNQLESNLSDLCNNEDVITLEQIKSDSNITHQIKSELSNLSLSMKIDEIINHYPHIVTIFLSDTAQSSHDESLFWKDVFSIIQTNEESDILKQKYSANFNNVISQHTNLLQNSDSNNFFPFLLLHALFTNETIEKLRSIQKENPEISEENLITKIIQEIIEKTGTNDGNERTEPQSIGDITNKSKSVVYQLALIALFDSNKVRSNNAKLSLKQLLKLETENIDEYLVSDINQLIYSWDHKDNLQTALEKIGGIESSIFNLKTNLFDEQIKIQKSIQDLLDKGPLVEINEILSAIEKIENNNIESIISPINKQLESVSLKIDDIDPSKEIKTIISHIEDIENRQDEIYSSINRISETLDFETNSIKEIIKKNKPTNSGLDLGIITEKLDQVYEEISILKNSIPTAVTSSLKALDGKIEKIYINNENINNSISTLNQNLSIIDQNISSKITEVNSNINNNDFREIFSSLEGLKSKMDNYNKTLLSNSDNLSTQMADIHTNLKEISSHEIVSEIKSINDNIIKTQLILDTSLQTFNETLNETSTSLNKNVKEINGNLKSSITEQILNSMQDLSQNIIQSQTEFSQRIETLNNLISAETFTINDQLKHSSDIQETISNSIHELNTNISSQSSTIETVVDNVGQTQIRIENSFDELSNRLIQNIERINTTLQNNQEPSKNNSSDFISTDEIDPVLKAGTGITKHPSKSRLISLKTKVDKNGKKSTFVVFDWKRKKEY